MRVNLLLHIIVFLVVKVFGPTTDHPIALELRFLMGICSEVGQRFATNILIFILYTLSVLQLHFRFLICDKHFLVISRYLVKDILVKVLSTEKPFFILRWRREHYPIDLITRNSFFVWCGMRSFCTR